ncbi:MAG: hypothetical protein IJW59_01645 [Clostridia bacterium]|nr:hypothetical protein [Clostridia bacterium]
MKNTGMQYIKCPRCELNYILKKDKFCDVCKSEMKAGILKESDLEELELMEEGMEICPICKVNYINPGEHMCSTCREEQVDSSKDDEPDWRGFVDNADDNDEELDLLPIEEDDEIDEELEGAFAKDLDDSDFDDSDEDEESDSDDLDDDFSDDFDDEDDFEDDDDDEEDLDEDDDDDLY